MDTFYNCRIEPVPEPVLPSWLLGWSLWWQGMFIGTAQEFALVMGDESFNRLLQSAYAQGVEDERAAFKARMIRTLKRDLVVEMLDPGPPATRTEFAIELLKELAEKT